MENSPTYKISKGLKEKFYTLWIEDQRSLVYLTNLSHDAEKAAEKAEKIAGYKVNFDFELVGRFYEKKEPMQDLNDFVNFGKYRGEILIKTLIRDPKYWVYLIETLDFGTKKFKNLIKGTEEYQKEIKSSIEKAEKEKAEKEKALPVPEGKQIIEGEILSIKEKATDYGVFKKLTIKENRGFKIWGTQPKTKEILKVGDKISFNCTLTKSFNDEKFGFYKRPTKTKILN